MLGSVANGLAAYAFVAVGARSYGADAFAPVSVLWTFWAVTVALFTFPVQHWVIRTVEVEASESSVRRELPALILASILASLLLGGVAALWRDQLFGSTSWVWPVLVLVVGVGGMVVGYLRGVLAGRRRFVAAGIATGLENMVRFAVGVAIVAIGASVGWFAAALAAGPSIILLWPSVMRLDTDAEPREHRLVEFIGGLGGGVLLSQIALNAGPAVLAAAGGSPGSVTAFFATLAVFRAPYLLALGLATRLTGPLTALVVAGDETRLRSLNRRFLVATGVTTVAALGVGATVGPAVVDLIFGKGVAPSSWVTGLIALGSALALAGLAAVLMLLVQGATIAILWSWTGGIAVGVVTLLAWPADPSPRVAIAFVVTEAAALAAMGLAHRRRRRHRGG